MPDATVPDIPGLAGLPGRIGKLPRRRTGPLILELDLTEGLTDEPAADPVSALLTMRRARLGEVLDGLRQARADQDRKSTRLNSSHLGISYAVFCLKK